MSRPYLYVLPFLIALIFDTHLFLAESLRTTTVSLRPFPGPLLVVPVKINGSGPYDFILDTGSTVTILDGPLFRELGLRSDGNTQLASPVATVAQFRATAKEVSVNGIGVVNLKVAEMETLRLGSMDRLVRGILGENFLDQFDLLIDNEHRQVTLDATAGLANLFDGEHLTVSPMSSFQGTVVAHRPIVSVIVPSYNSRPLRLLLDTGAAALAIFPREGTQRRALNGGNATAMQMTTPNGDLACATWRDKLHWGKSAVSWVDVLACQGVTAEKLDNEGSLPTHIFKRILVIHSGMYAVLNPVRRGPVAQEVSQIPPQGR
jgi:predicted aspartyl protease